MRRDRKERTPPRSVTEKGPLSRLLLFREVAPSPLCSIARRSDGSGISWPLHVSGEGRDESLPIPSAESPPVRLCGQPTEPTLRYPSEATGAVVNAKPRLAAQTPAFHAHDVPRKAG
jgi:hypothetical protein